MMETLRLAPGHAARAWDTERRPGWPDRSGADGPVLWRAVGNRAVADLLAPGVTPGAGAGGRQDPGLAPDPGPAGSGAVDASAAVPRSAGDALDPAVRERMEGRFGHDFGDVRVHVDRWAAASALEQGARAYTVGRHIVFGEGRYAPGTGDGERLLAHELAHVVQQAAGTAGGAGAETEARRAAARVAVGRGAGMPAPLSGGAVTGGGAVAVPAGAVQRDDLTDEDRRRLAASRCPSGRCHDPVPPSHGPSVFTGSGTLPAGGAGGAAGGAFGMSPAELEALRRWVQSQDNAGQDRPARAAADPDTRPLPVMTPPSRGRTAPGIENLPRRRKVIRVVEVFVPETRFASPLGSFGTRMLSQADVVTQYTVVIDRPDPTAGYNFDTYLSNIGTNQWTPAQYLGGTRFRVFMGTPECPGCHFGRGLEIDLKGQSFITVMAEGLMTATAISDMAGMVSRLGRRPPLPTGLGGAAADEAALAPRPGPRTPDDEFNDFIAMTREEGATEFRAAGEPVTMQPHGGASDARATLGLSGDNQSMHGLPRSVGKHLPGYDPQAALTTLGDRALHTELDQPWKDAFQTMRRQGRTTANAQEVYDAVADSIQRSSQLSQGVKDTLKARLYDEMFVEYGLAPAQSMTLPYPNIRPAP